jgi:hypothetical protein
MLVESASAICNTLRQGIPNIFPGFAPPRRFALERIPGFLYQTKHRGAEPEKVF